MISRSALATVSCVTLGLASYVGDQLKATTGANALRLIGLAQAVTMISRSALAAVSCVTLGLVSYVGDQLKATTGANALRLTRLAIQPVLRTLVLKPVPVDWKPDKGVRRSFHRKTFKFNVQPLEYANTNGQTKNVSRKSVLLLTFLFSMFNKRNTTSFLRMKAAPIGGTTFIPRKAT